jgi:hypothetical protein
MELFGLARDIPVMLRFFCFVIYFTTYRTAVQWKSHAVPWCGRKALVGAARMVTTIHYILYHTNGKKMLSNCELVCLKYGCIFVYNPMLIVGCDNYAGMPQKNIMHLNKIAGISGKRKSFVL